MFVFFALGNARVLSFALGDAKVLSFALGDAKVLSFALGDAKVPNSKVFGSQWNIGLKVKKIVFNCYLLKFSLESQYCEPTP